VSLFLDPNSLRRAAHRPYSLDLARSDFWFFECLKPVVQGSSFDELDKLSSPIQEILRGINRETLDAVFQEWMIRQQKCNDENDEYVE
jgi:hypothetical protein